MLRRVTSMKNFTDALILAPIFLYLLTLREPAVVFYNQRAGTMIAVAILIGGYFWKKYGFLVGLFAGYAMSSAVWMGYTRVNKFHLLGPSQVTIQYYILLGCLSALGTWIAVAEEIVPRKTMAFLWAAFSAFQMVHFLFMRHWFATDGFMMTYSVSGVSMVFMIPLASKYFPRFNWVLVPMALWMGNITAAAALCAYAFGYAIARRRFLLAAIGSVLGMDVAYLVHRQITGPYGLGQHRFPVWEVVFEWFMHSPYKLFGTGAGSAYVMVPMIQQASRVFEYEGYVYLHNELLQVFFELGYVGVGLVLAIYGRLVWASWKRGDGMGLGFLFALIPASLALFPFRLETFLFLTAFLLDDLLKKQNLPVKLST